MHFYKTNFYHHFNQTKPKNYSEQEIRFILEVKSAVKEGGLIDKQLDKKITKNENRKDSY